MKRISRKEIEKWLKDLKKVPSTMWKDAIDNHLVKELNKEKKHDEIWWPQVGGEPVKTKVHSGTCSVWLKNDVLVEITFYKRD